MSTVLVALMYVIQQRSGLCSVGRNSTRAPAGVARFSREETGRDGEVVRGVEVFRNRACVVDGYARNMGKYVEKGLKSRGDRHVNMVKATGVKIAYKDESG